MIQYEESLIVSSDAANGALNKNLSSFDVQLHQPISIPREAKNVTLEVTSSVIWNTVPNISALRGNNKLYIYTDAGGTPAAPTGVLTTITIPDGLYSLDSLKDMLPLLLASEGLDENLFEVLGNDSTQQVVFKINAQNVWLDFTRGDSPNNIFGLNSRLVPETTFTTTDISYAETDNVAAFNQLNSFLLHCTIVSGGLPINAFGQNIICNIPITSKPGSQIVYQPYNPTKVNCNELTGMSLGSFSVYLSDEKNNILDNFGDEYSFVMTFKYYA